jgi:hypothetical protein
VEMQGDDVAKEKFAVPLQCPIAGAPFLDGPSRLEREDDLLRATATAVVSFS